jgi:hypothetical protein
VNKAGPGQLGQSAEHLGKGSAAARTWVDELARTAASVASEQQSLIELTRRAENLGRKLAASAARRNCVGVFGPSQAGKSYLVSVLARKEGAALLADFAGAQKNFISEINPPGERESTGLVTRFTVEKGTRDATHPVELRLLSETDLVKILGNTFLSDFDANQRKVQPPDEETIRAAIAESEAHAREPQPHLDEIAMFDIGEYFSTYLAAGVANFKRAGYWDALVRFGHRLPFAARVQFYSLLWGRIDDFTRLFTTFANALEQLGHAPEARAKLDVLIPREHSIIDVETLSRLGTPEDDADAISVIAVGAKEPAAPVRVPRAVLTGLVAEVKIVMAEQPWPFFEYTDLLDFPGARSREKQIDLPSDPAEREDRVRNMLLRGKIAYLFQRYTEQRELTCMLLCMPPSNVEVKDLDGMVKGWVEQTHGDTAAERRKVPCALFLVLTKFDMDFIEKAGDTSESRRTKFEKRLDASFLKPYKDEWVRDWNGEPFNNTLFLRNPGMKQPHIIEYARTTPAEDGSEPLVELGLNQDFVEKHAEYRAAFVSSAVCAKHFRQMSEVWDAAFKLNNGGVSLLVSRLEQVLSPELKSRQITARLVEQAKALDARLRRFYRSEDAGSLKEKEEALVDLQKRLAASAQSRKLANFTHYLACLTLSEADAREALLNVAAMKNDATAPAAEKESAAASNPDLDDLLSEILDKPEPAASAAASGKQALRQRDRYDLFANHVLNLWTEKVRGLALNAQALAALGIDAQLAGDLANELVVGAHRCGLMAAIAQKVRSQLQAANVRWDDIADRCGVIAATAINDYVGFLGFATLPQDQRPKQRQRAVFQTPDLPDGAPELEERRKELEKEYFVDWVVSLRQLGLDNVTFSGGREIDEKQNARLGEILATLQVASAMPVA